MNYILIGMPGSGKTTIGKQLAESLGMAFLDTDHLIEQRHAATLEMLIQHEGLPTFLKLEEDTILNLNCDNTVIATGGSVPMSPAAVAHLKSIGNVVFLNVPLEELQTRIGPNLVARGVAGSTEHSLAQIFTHRLPHYQQAADLTLNIPPAETTTQTLSRLQTMLQN